MDEAWKSDIYHGFFPHEAQLRCPDDVSGDIGGCSARRAFKPKFYQPTQTMVTAGILPFRENSHDRAGNFFSICFIHICLFYSST